MAEAYCSLIKCCFVTRRNKKSVLPSTGCEHNRQAKAKEAVQHTRTTRQQQ